MLNILGDPQVFPNQFRDIILPGCPGSIMLREMQGKCSESRSLGNWWSGILVYNITKPPQLAYLNMREQELLFKIKWLFPPLPSSHLSIQNTHPEIWWHRCKANRSLTIAIRSLIPSACMGIFMAGCLLRMINAHEFNKLSISLGLDPRDGSSTLFHVTPLQTATSLPKCALVSLNPITQAQYHILFSKNHFFVHI